MVIPYYKADSHVLLTRLPLMLLIQVPITSVRLACVKHAASVHSEPGSNSQFKFDSKLHSSSLCLQHPKRTLLHTLVSRL